MRFKAFLLVGLAAVAASSAEAASPGLRCTDYTVPGTYTWTRPYGISHVTGFVRAGGSSSGGAWICFTGTACSGAAGGSAGNAEPFDIPATASWLASIATINVGGGGAAPPWGTQGNGGAVSKFGLNVQSPIVFGSGTSSPGGDSVASASGGIGSSRAAGGDAAGATAGTGDTGEGNGASGVSGTNQTGYLAPSAGGGTTSVGVAKVGGNTDRGGAAGGASGPGFAATPASSVGIVGGQANHTAVGTAGTTNGGNGGAGGAGGGSQGGSGGGSGGVGTASNGGNGGAGGYPAGGGGAPGDALAAASTTTTSAAVAGTNSFTITSATAVATGQHAFDMTVPAAIDPVATITLSGTTVTLGSNVLAPGVGNGDTVRFGAYLPGNAAAGADGEVFVCSE